LGEAKYLRQTLYASHENLASSNHGCHKGVAGGLAPGFEILYFPIKLLVKRLRMGKMKFHHCLPLEKPTIVHPPGKNPPDALGCNDAHGNDAHVTE